ncbi:MAG: ankyrin repeat domain-containing protein [Rickettsiaceae bacterium]|nr:ankyrin repeat domain-containing protein [Rickettsiaceae bacterium]
MWSDPSAYSCRKRSFRIAKSLLANVIAANVKSIWSKTPLHIAEEKRSLETKLLLEKDADKCKNRFGQTPLQIAEEKGHLE